MDPRITAFAVQHAILTSQMVLCAGLQQGHGSSNSSGYGGIAKRNLSTEEQGLVLRSSSHRSPMVLHFRHLGSPGDIWQCPMHSYQNLQRSGDLLASSEWRPEVVLIHTQDRPMAECHPDPKCQPYQRWEILLDKRVQSDGEFSKAALVMCESEQ